MFAIVEQQVVSATAELTERSLDDRLRWQRMSVLDNMQVITTTAGDKIDGRAQYFEVRVAAAGPRDPLLAIGKVHDATIAKVDPMMLKGDPSVVSPHKKMVATCQLVSPQRAASSCGFAIGKQILATKLIHTEAWPANLEKKMETIPADRDGLAVWFGMLPPRSTRTRYVRVRLRIDLIPGAPGSRLKTARQSEDDNAAS